MIDINYDMFKSMCDSIPASKLIILTRDNFNELRKTIPMELVQKNIYKVSDTGIYVLISMFAPSDHILIGENKF